MSDPSPPRSALIAIHPWIGDVVLSHSLVRALHAQGTAEIDVLGAQWSSPIASMMPEVGQVFAHDIVSGELGLGKRWRLGRQARERGYAVAYILQGTIKAALPPWFAGIPRRIGLREEWRYGLLTEQRDNPGSQVHTARILASLAYPPEADFELLPPQLQPPAGRAEQAAERNDLDLADEWVALCPGAASKLPKRWPAPNYGALASSLASDGRRIMLLGSPNDKQDTAATAAAAGLPAGQLVDLAGKLDLVEASALLAHCKLVVANDSGLMHVGAALGVPTVGVLGPQPASLYGPLGKCTGFVEPPDGSRQVERISVEEVAAKVAEVMALRPGP